MADEASFVYAGIPFRLQNTASPSVAGTGDNVRVTVRYLVPYGQWQDAYAALLGYPTATLTKGPDQGWISRTLPHTPGWDIKFTDKFYCKDITQVEFRSPLLRAVIGEPNFEDAEMTVVYERLPYIIRPDLEMIFDWTKNNRGRELPFEGQGSRFVHWREKSKSYNLKTKAGVYHWKGTGPPPKKPLEGVLMPISKTECTAIWHQVPLAVAPLAIAIALKGKTNAEALRHYAAKTLLLDAVDYEEGLDGQYNQIVNMKYTLTYVPQGSSFFPDPERGNAFSELARDADPAKGVFETGDFNMLFWPDFETGGI